MKVSEHPGSSGSIIQCTHSYPSIPGWRGQCNQTKYFFVRGKIMMTWLRLKTKPYNLKSTLPSSRTLLWFYDILQMSTTHVQCRYGTSTAHVQVQYVQMSSLPAGDVSAWTATSKQQHVMCCLLWSTWFKINYKTHRAHISNYFPFLEKPGTSLTFLQ